MGQNCAGPERFLVYESVYDKFNAALLAVIKQMRVGVPLDDARVDCGALRMPSAPTILEQRVKAAVSAGARLLYGGHVVQGVKGQFFEPTLLVDVTDNMAIAQDEIFGPILCVMRVAHDSDDEAVRIANNCGFALGACVFSGSQARAARILWRIRAGLTAVNDLEGTSYLSQSLPFGGVGLSGGGRFAGVEGLRGVCYARSVVENRAAFLQPSIPAAIAYPSRGAGAQFCAGLVRVLYGYSLAERVAGVLALIKASTK